MSCNTSSISVFQGDTWNQSFTFLNDDDTPIDLSGYTEIRMEVRKKYGMPVLIDASITDGNITVTGVDSNVVNFVNIDIPDDADAGGYIFDIECSNVTSKQTYGIFELIIKKQVTV